jgi:hypothetical protein
MGEDQDVHAGKLPGRWDGRTWSGAMAPGPDIDIGR